MKDAQRELSRAVPIFIRPCTQCGAKPGERCSDVDVFVRDDAFREARIEKKP